MAVSAFRGTRLPFLHQSQVYLFFYLLSSVNLFPFSALLGLTTKIDKRHYSLLNLEAFIFQFPIARNVSGRSKKMIQGRNSKGFVLSAQYSQTQDLFTSRLQSTEISCTVIFLQSVSVANWVWFILICFLGDLFLELLHIRITLTLVKTVC